VADNFIYILSESDIDDIYYSLCVEKIKEQAYKLIPRRLRRGGGISQVRRYLRILLKNIRYSGEVENTFFVIAYDNDRSPAHPTHRQIPNIGKLPKNERRKACRFCELEITACEILGADRNTWPIKGAIAVPVQMLESWLLLICNREEYKNEASLPLFARKSMPLAKIYYAPREPENQLKDLVELEKRKSGITSTEDFCLYCIEQLTPEELALVSPSFSLFMGQLEGW
jgi:hypothetical protein